MTAFVDWEAQIHNMGAYGNVPQHVRAQRTLEQTVRSVGAGMAQATEHERAQRTLERTVRAVRSALMSEEKSRFRVSFRLYHGWHKGWQPTDGLKAVLQAVDATDFTALSYDRVDFSPTVQYGHTLLAALPERKHHHQRPRLLIHLPNTLRDQEKGKPLEEKMVDTALAADLLAWAHQSPSEWALVLAEDDDMIPPLFTAEAWIKPHGGRALLLRKRGAGQYLRLDGLRRRLK